MAQPQSSADVVCVDWRPFVAGTIKRSRLAAQLAGPWQGVIAPSWSLAALTSQFAGNATADEDQLSLLRGVWACGTFRSTRGELRARRGALGERSSSAGPVSCDVLARLFCPLGRIRLSHKSRGATLRLSCGVKPWSSGTGAVHGSLRRRRSRSTAAFQRAGSSRRRHRHRHAPLADGPRPHRSRSER